MWLNATFVPTLRSDTPSSMEVVAEGTRLACITHEDVEFILQEML